LGGIVLLSMKADCLSTPRFDFYANSACNDVNKFCIVLYGPAFFRFTILLANSKDHVSVRDRPQGARGGPSL